MLLEDLVDAYGAHRRLSGLSAETLRVEASVLRGFVGSVGNMPVRRIGPADLDRWLGDHRLAASTRQSQVSRVRQMFAWAVVMRIIPTDPTVAVRSVRIPRRDHARLPAARFAELLRATTEPRARLACALGLYGMLRVSEIRSIRWDDVDLVADTLHVTVHKTDDVDELPICLELHNEFVAYKSWYVRALGSPDGALPLLPSRRVVPSGPVQWRRDEPWCNVNHAVKRALADIGVAGMGVGTHTLRRSGARGWFDALRDDGHDGAIQRVRAMLHHSSSSMTERYLGLSEERAQRDRLLRGAPMFAGSQLAVVRTVGDIRGGDDGRL